MTDPRSGDPGVAPLTFRRVRDLLPRCAAIHRAVGDELLKRSNTELDEEQKVLLRTIANAELELAETLNEASQRLGEEEAAPGDGDAWLQSTPASLLHDARRRTGRLESLPVIELDQEARAVSRCLTRFFGELRAAAPTPGLQDLFDGLEAIEQRYDRRYTIAVDASLV